MQLSPARLVKNRLLPLKVQRMFRLMLPRPSTTIRL
jgi:hypothetical protein